MTPMHPYTVEERQVSDATWVGLRARGAEWSWLTPDEAVAIARIWLEQYASKTEGATP